MPEAGGQAGTGGLGARAGAGYAGLGARIYIYIYIYILEEGPPQGGRCCHCGWSDGRTGPERAAPSLSRMPGGRMAAEIGLRREARLGEIEN